MAIHAIDHPIKPLSQIERKPRILYADGRQDLPLVQENEKF